MMPPPKRPLLRRVKVPAPAPNPPTSASPSPSPPPSQQQQPASPPSQVAGPHHSHGEDEEQHASSHPPPSSPPPQQPRFFHGMKKLKLRSSVGAASPPQPRTPPAEALSSSSSLYTSTTAAAAAATAAAIHPGQFHRAIQMTNAIVAAEWERSERESGSTSQSGWTSVRSSSPPGGARLVSVPLYSVWLITNGSTMLVLDFNGSGHHDKFAGQVQPILKRVAAATAPMAPGSRAKVSYHALNFTPAAIAAAAGADTGSTTNPSQVRLPLSGSLLGVEEAEAPSSKAEGEAAAAGGGGRLSSAFHRRQFLYGSSTAFAMVLEGSALVSYVLEEMCNGYLPPFLEGAYPYGVRLEGRWITEAPLVLSRPVVPPPVARLDEAMNGTLLCLPVDTVRELQHFIASLREEEDGSDEVLQLPLFAGKGSRLGGVSQLGEARQVEHQQWKRDATITRLQQRQEDDAAAYMAVRSSSTPSLYPSASRATEEGDPLRAASSLSRPATSSESHASSSYVGTLTATGPPLRPRDGGAATTMVTIYTPQGRVRLTRDREEGAGAAAGERKPDRREPSVTLADCKASLLRSALGRSMRLRLENLFLFYAPGTPFLQDSEVFHTEEVVLRLSVRR